MADADQRQLDDRPQPVIAVDDSLLRHVEAGDYVATIEPTRRLSQQALDVLYEATLSACQREVDIGVTLKLFQHVRANLEYYVAYFAAKPRVTYFCTDRVEDAIKIRLCLERLGRRQKVLLLYACAPELANLYVTHGIEPCVFDPWWIEQALLHKSNLKDPLKIHLWVDVGMSREGMLPTDIGRILPALARDGIVVEGVATHFNAVAQDHAIQKSRFEEVLRMLGDNGIRPRIVHAIASHNGLGYSDLTGSLSPGKAKLDVLYDMVRPGCALGMGPRWNLGSYQEEVLRIAIPTREARIAHIKEVPTGWNLGYWDNKFAARKRIGVLETARLSALKYETFQRRPGGEAEILRSMLSHGSIAAIDLSRGEWKVGDVLTCHTTMWMCFLSRGFERKEDGSCLVAVKDAASGNTTHVRIVTQELPNEHLLHNIEQSVGMLLNHHLECVTRKKRMAWFVKDLLTRAIYAVLLLTYRIRPLAKKVNSVLVPINCA
jgi:hypothetical protein